jgi:hypothetical protein
MSDTWSKLSRTKPFSPSKISLINNCPLRYLLETENFVSVGPPSNLYALVGTVIHKLVEINLSRPSISGIELKKQFIESINKLAIRGGESVVNWVYANYGLNGLLSNERVISSVQQVKRLLAKYGDDKSEIKVGSNLIAHFICPDGLGSEKWFEHKKLELGGKIDFSYIDEEGMIHIVDFKSGKVLDEEGQPKDDYLLQIGAYGLMVEEFTDSSNILLELIGSHTTWTGKLDETLRARVLNSVSEAQKTLPLNHEIDASTLSKSGEHCSSCRSRFSCDEYRLALRNRSFGGANSICSPNDLFGTVSRVTKHENLIDILVNTNNGITCSIIGLPDGIYHEIKIGDLIAAYFLGVLDIESRCAFPVNFFIVRGDAPRLSSFESLVIIEAKNQ